MEKKIVTFPMFLRFLKSSKLFKELGFILVNDRFRVLVENAPEGAKYGGKITKRGVIVNQILPPSRYYPAMIHELFHYFCMIVHPLGERYVNDKAHATKLFKFAIRNEIDAYCISCILEAEANDGVENPKAYISKTIVSMYVPAAKKENGDNDLYSDKVIKRMVARRYQYFTENRTRLIDAVKGIYSV